VRAKAITAALALGAIVALLLPAGALAASRTVRQPAASYLELNLRGTHGFHISLFTVPGRAPSLSALKFDGEEFEAVSYSRLGRVGGPGDPGRGLLDTRIGRLGRFRGHFVPRSTKTEPSQRGCTGGPTTVERGVFVGSFRFRGELDYTQVRATRAHGSITRRAAQRCVVPDFAHHPGKKSGQGRETRRKGEFKLIAAGSKASPFLQAERSDESRRFVGSANVSASAESEVGDFTVSHLATSSQPDPDPASTFAVPDLAAPLDEATIAPPAPFSGSATFRSDGATSGSWTGDLRVDLPGLGRVPLTGGGIEAGLCVGGSGCTKTLPERLQPVLEAPPGVIVAVTTVKKGKR
jgi:hypothetical protein